MKVPLHPCYILHQRPYRETSLIMEVFSREHGKLSVVAKGAKRGRVNQRAIMQSNQKINMAWSIRGDMGTLTAIEANGMNFNLNGSLLIAAFYINELLMRLLHRHEPHPELFDAYDQALNGLRLRENEQNVLRIFEKRLLDSLGYGLVLDHEVVSGGPIEEDRTYYYHLESGPALEPSPDNNHVRISGSTLTALAGNRIKDDRTRDEAKKLTRQVLKGHLGDRPLASRELFRAYIKTVRSEEEGGKSS